MSAEYAKQLVREQAVIVQVNPDDQHTLVAGTVEDIFHIPIGVGLTIVNVLVGSVPIAVDSSRIFAA